MDKIGKYKIIETLGKGAMGEVFKAKDEVIDRIVAIKVIHPHFLEQEVWDDMKARFKQEATAAARCLHPNIVTIFDFGVFEDTPYLVMEYIEGPDVKYILDKNGAFSLKESISIMADVLNALHYAHQHGVVHRDIKPANIIKLTNGQIKVADFGIARIDSSELTNIGDMVGTPIYMSPEALRGDSVDARSDIYAAALVLLELLSGKKPITGFVDSQSLSEQIISANIPVSYQQELLDVLLCALHRKAENRFQQANDFASKLSEILIENVSLQQTSNLQVEEDDNATMIVESPMRQNAMNENEISAIDNASILDSIEQSLTSYIGPLSSILVKRTASSSANVSQIVNQLSQHITDKNQRAEFIDKFDKQQEKSNICSKIKSASSVNQPTIPLNISEERIAFIIDNLAKYIGPMAPILVKRTLKKSNDELQLLTTLAEEIPHKTEQDEFLAQCN